ncbi:Alpha-tocopherol transfer protein-like, partial [Gonioctena quinquepunctata]
VIYPLPKLCPNGELVILLKLMDDNLENYSFPLLIRCFDMITLSYLHQNGPPDGLIILFDMDGISFSHFLKVSIVVMKKLLYYLQEGMPIRLKGLHFCNIVSFMDKLLAMMKPFMKQELVESLFLHVQMDTVYDYVPKMILPKDYGGACESLQILHGKYKDQMYNNEELFKYQELQLVDESKRIEESVEMGNVFGMVGTFKRLELD